jgi:FAD/FMN-containing dehydrogenase
MRPSASIMGWLRRGTDRSSRIEQNMKRRQFLQTAAAIPVVWAGSSQVARVAAEGSASASVKTSRVRPSDPGWPSLESWGKLKQEVGGRLIELKSRLAACRSTPQSDSCADLFKELKNPYYIGDQPALTQTCGWVDAWTSAPSVYAVAAARTADIVAAVNFAREHNLRLVVKGGGHSYQGTSNAPDSLLVWTRAMNDIVLHDAFVPQGCAGKLAPQPAVTIGAGAIWMHAYDAVTTRAGRYVQGGGCATVGVAGLVQSGGFGSFSKNYGTAAAGLLEAEIVLADGSVQIANACSHPELFWALKGGGGGSLGIVSKLTLCTRELPEYFGVVVGTIKARSDAAFKALIAHSVDFYHDRLFNPHWGEQLRFQHGNRLDLHMVWQGLTREQAQATWRPFLDWIAGRPGDFTVKTPVRIVALPARHFWDAKFWDQLPTQTILHDDRPNAPKGNVFWAGNREEAGQFVHGFRSAWLPASLLEKDRQSTLVEALFAGSRQWSVSLHCNKGLAGARVEELAAAKDTAMNPAVLDAFALAIIAGNSEPAFPGVPGHEPNVSAARRDAGAINRAMEEVLKIARQAGSYISESDYFEHDWQQSFWGPNYPRLVAAKQKYDPAGLFFVHHGVGSEDWSADGFTRVGS